MAEVSGEYFVSDGVVWENGVFPYRIPLDFVYVLPAGKRVPTRSVIKDRLMKAWGYNWGWGIQAKYPVPPQQADEILNYIAEMTGKKI